MQARMKNPALILPGAMQAIQGLNKAKQEGGVAATTLGLMHLRVSQINGCSVCVDSGSKHLKKMGESDERIFAIAAWRDSPHFTDAECAALALAEAVTRLGDRVDPVSDDIWDAAARHYDERALAALILEIATTNVFNRLNVTTRQVGATWAQGGEAWNGGGEAWAGSKNDGPDSGAETSTSASITKSSGRASKRIGRMDASASHLKEY
jgi:AhpD family alkylhydroperoxidase